MIDIEQVAPVSVALAFLVRAHEFTASGRGPARWRLRKLCRAYLRRRFDFITFLEVEGAAHPDKTIREIRLVWGHNDELAKELSLMLDALDDVRDRFPEMERIGNGQPYGMAAYISNLPPERGL